MLAAGEDRNRHPHVAMRPSSALDDAELLTAAHPNAVQEAYAPDRCENSVELSR